MKKKKSFLRIFFIVGGLVLALCLVLTYCLYITNKTDFLTNLKEHEMAKDALVKAWPELASKARTSMHYLMLLKRLHSYQLHEAYERVLMRALWRHKSVSSIVALGADYFLQQYSVEGDRIVSTSAHSFVMHAELKKFLDDVIVILWDRYPNMVRLYYMAALEDGAYLGKVSEDELLRLYQKLRTNQASWNDYNALWLMTRERTFLSLYIAFAQKSGEFAVAERAYKDYLKTYTVSYSSRSDVIISSHLALLMKDRTTLTMIAEHQKSEDVFLNLVSSFMNEGNYEDAWKVATNYNAKLMHASSLWDFVYFWLASRYAKHTPADISSLYHILRMKHPNAFSLAYEYWTYCYLQEKGCYQDTQVASGLVFSNGFFADSRVAFLKLVKQNAGQLPSSINALWRSYNANENSSLWKDILASYFLNNELYEEFAIFQQKHRHESFILPYEFFLAIKRKEFKTIDRLLKVPVSSNMRIHATDAFPWWHYYNVAVLYNAQKDYDAAYYFLQKAEALYRSSYYRNGYQYMPYILIQYAYAARGRNDIEGVQVFIDKIRNMMPTFVYLQKFEDSNF